jgi:hypothetical protein
VASTDKKFWDEARGCGLVGMGTMFLLISTFTRGGDWFTLSNCVYKCGGGYLAVVSIAVVMLGLYLAYRKPPQIT